MRKVACISTALVLALAAGCGGDEEGEPIPRGEAQDLITVLDLIENNVDSGACGGARAKIRNDLPPIVDRLPADVDAEVRSALEESIDRLGQLVEDECGRDEEPTDTQETETQPTETETQPTETETTPTETTPTEEEPPPTETQPTETTPPPDQGDPPLPAPDEDGGAPAPGAGGARRTR